MIRLSGTHAPVSAVELAEIALRIADQPGQWLGLVTYDAARRCYHRLSSDDEHEIWLLSWLPGQRTGFHDHGPSSGAFAVACGHLRERSAPGGRPEPSGRTLTMGAVRAFGSQHVHDVGNESALPAVSIHAYSPPLSSMRRYGISASGLLRVAGEDRSW